jgi:hypothetical protein
MSIPLSKSVYCLTFKKFLYSRHESTCKYILSPLIFMFYPSGILLNSVTDCHRILKI